LNGTVYFLSHRKGIKKASRKDANPRWRADQLSRTSGTESRLVKEAFRAGQGRNDFTCVQERWPNSAELWDHTRSPERAIHAHPDAAGEKIGCYRCGMSRPEK